MQWQDEISDCLANLHPVQITEGIVKPAIDQLIEDYEDSLKLYDEDEKDQIEMTKHLIAFWRGIKKQVEKEKLEVLHG